MRRRQQKADIAYAGDDDQIVPDKKMRAFRICEEHKVKSYLNRRLSKLQQQANKRIAKAWVKAICPKKQARFPYQNKLRLIETGDPPRVPEWWPIQDCPFTEPDHIDKNRKEALYPVLVLRPD